MKKSEILRNLKKIQALFVENQKVDEAFEVIFKELDSLPKETFETKSKAARELTIPAEAAGLERAYLLFSDGACRGNPGPGAWACLIQDVKGEILLQSSGVDVPTTNNKMELQGVISALEGLIDRWVQSGMSEREIPVFVYSDSKYVVDGISSWVSGWKSRGWKKADGKLPENVELWQQLDSLNSQFSNIKYIWVKGHAGHPQNELCDQMCNQALDEAGL